MEAPSDLSDRVTAWRFVLSPWIASLWDRITLTIPELPQRNDLETNLWIQFAPQKQADERRAWLVWLEAFELLDILASRDSRACWDILLDLSRSKHRLPSLGCPQDLFYGLRPRYEMSFQFLTLYFPREDVVSLITGGIPDKDHSPEYAAAKAELLALDGPRNKTPIQLRWRFPISISSITTNQIETKRYIGRLNHVLALVTTATTTPTTRASRHAISAIGFCHNIHTSNDARDIIRRIACHIPVFTMALGEPMANDHFQTNYFGPFMWRMLAPQPSKRRHLGLERITMASVQVRGADYLAGACSAIAQSHTLREVAFTASGQGDWSTWFAFALFSKTASHHIHTASLTFNDTASVRFSNSVASNVEALREVVEHPNPVAYLAAVHDGGGVAKRLVKWAPTTVRVNAQAPIYVRDHLRAASTVYHGKQVTVCHVADNEPGEFVRVLIPGVGFSRVHRCDVLSEEPTELRDAHAVRSLTITLPYTDVQYFTAILELVGAPLVTLKLIASGYCKGATLRVAEILAHCPRLKHLTLIGQSVAAETLLPSRWGRELVSLTLRHCAVVAQENYQLCITPRMAPQLSCLFVSMDTRSKVVNLRGLAMELLASGRLTRLALACIRSREGDNIEKYQQLKARFHGQRFPTIPLRQKLAVLSVLATGPRYALCNEILSLVFEMAAAPVQRRCCALDVL